MGQCCCSGLDQNTRYINNQLEREDKAQSRTNKLLFLGPGGSGKSTIFKQLQWLYHPDGFREDDRLMLREHIFCQITQQMKAAIKHYIYKEALTVNNKNGKTTTITMSQLTHTQESQVTQSNDGDNNSSSTPHSKENEIQKEDMLNIQNNNNNNNNIANPTDVDMDNVTYSGDEDTTIDEDAKMNGYDEISMQDAISIVQNHGDVTIFNDELADAITYIWKNRKEIRNAFKNTAKVKNKILDETTEYFWNEIDRIKDENYIPNETDIIKVRYRTTGVIERKFEINNAKFHIFDVGGQKSERKKMDKLF